MRTLADALFALVAILAVFCSSALVIGVWLGIVLWAAQWLVR